LRHEPRSHAAFALLLLAPIAECGGGTHVRDIGAASATLGGKAIEVMARARPSVPLVARPLVATATAAMPGPTSCPAGMALVVGNFCPEVEQRCLRFLDVNDGPYAGYRCAEFARPATCKGERRPMRYCIDVDEQGATLADPRPASRVSYDSAKQACAVRGARLCTESEFQFACEGEEMQPYPYGWSRDSTACNIDRTDLGSFGNLKDLREENGARARCVSPFGVRDLTGNLEEWAASDRPMWHKRSTLLMGSWWLPGRSTCRQVNAGHDSAYSGPETGYRCCQ
jgi:hypothetical protein